MARRKPRVALSHPTSTVAPFITPPIPTLSQPFTLFEVSWEVCNKASGVHTVLASKARSIVDQLGDDYVAVGPWLLSDSDREVPFDEEHGLDAFRDACRAAGTPIRVGRWRVPGRPRTVLVEFSQLYDQRDEILGELWDAFGVDSISGDWDYVEPLLFGWAAGRVLETWREEFLAPRRRRAVVQCHEWLTGSTVLYLRRHVPALATVLTAHGTVLGRALATAEHALQNALAEAEPAELAETHGVTAKHSLEGIATREADVVGTVSDTTARELELLHGRSGAEVLPCGLDLATIAEAATPTAVADAREALLGLARSFLGLADLGDAALIGTAGRYEFHNKGFDLLLDALAELNDQAGRPVVAFLLAPAPNSGVRSEVLERLAGERPADGPLGVCTHNLFDEDRDPIQTHCARLGLDNAPQQRVKVIHLPVFAAADDGLLGQSYDALLGAVHATCFPSYYEPWGLAPQESLAVGVPTVTTDCTGFGRWAREQSLGADAGIWVLDRERAPSPSVVTALTGILEELIGRDLHDTELAQVCRRTAVRFGWPDLIDRYRQAWRRALESLDTRSAQGITQARRPRRRLAVQAAANATEPRLVPFTVSATLPEPLIGLRALARNLWWCWSPHRALFEELSPRAWESSGHNPVAVLQNAYADDLRERAADGDYCARVQRASAELDEYLSQRPQGGTDGPSADRPVAYFCAEFGLHESLPIYSGGLGILAGDHLKSASDLNVPLVAVGLFYRMGYMGQRLTAAGEQVAIDRENDPDRLPLDAVLDPNGEPLHITLKLPGRSLTLRAWTVAVGRVTLYLLDSNVAQNLAEDRDITRNLYGGDAETRIVQEIVLGRGGVRLLRQLDIHPSVYHMNEGHAAFLTLERIARLVREEGLTFDAAREMVRGTTLFTTHTPVPAGHDRFNEDLMRRYFSDAAEWVGLPWERFYALGNDGGEGGEFNMTHLALAFSSWRNGVSKLHGEVSRSLLAGFWPALLESEVPIASVTNGIHLKTWTSPEILTLSATEPAPDPAALWRARGQLKRRLLDAVEARLKASFVARGDSPALLEQLLGGLDENALLIGFARRFAPYKRADLMFTDRDRLQALLDDTERPVRVLVAGKAHPRDERGKEIVRAVVERSREPAFRGRVIFLEDYDMALAYALVCGVDVWLNNPIRPMEASGTSGMKAAANGALNLSVSDGWWPEGFDGNNGWVIGDVAGYDDQELQNLADASALYRTLEEEVVPLYFDRDAAGVPQGWMARVAHTLASIPPQFNTDRMVSDYLRQAYRPLATAYHTLGADHRALAQHRARELARLRRGFEQVAFVQAQVVDLSQLRVGEAFEVRAEVELGSLSAEDVTVELVLGHADGPRNLRNLTAVTLAATGPAQGSVGAFSGTHTLERSGRYAHGLRVRARAPDLPGGPINDLVVWA